jgi:hypothetical protein
MRYPPGVHAKAPANARADAERRLDGFIAKFDGQNQKLIRSVRKALRRRFPTAHELVYDNYNFFVIGYSPTERPSDSILSMAAGANGVGLCFLRGATLPDPQGILLGSGNQTRFIRLESPAVLARAEVEALVAAAVAQSKTPFRRKGRGALVIRSVSAKQRPRRQPTKSRSPRTRAARAARPTPLKRPRYRSPTSSSSSPRPSSPQSP